ncbi:NADH-quinone oxidoreductase subunit J [Bacillus testis]|uniref:NADH-quinone oxidoreductase subunit J n=1 Tax=Bacillus testis TaxID=1622072 RepID=UPI00067F270E|nr:NADH-quinone oxidoreductase subunit J [Bacillus testis]
MNVSGEYVAFIALAAVVVGGGLMMLAMKKVVHMVLAAVFTFISIAGLYILLSAEFLAAVQILIYSGAITIMMLFGIMLTKQNDEEEKRRKKQGKWFALAGIAIFAAVVYMGIYDLDFGSEGAALHEDNTKQIGMELYSKYPIPFELASVLLLAALVGAVILAKREEGEEAE